MRRVFLFTIPLVLSLWQSDAQAQYNTQTKENPRNATKYDFNRNMDTLIDSLFNNDGFMSYIPIGGALGFGSMIGDYHTKYAAHVYKGHSEKKTFVRSFPVYSERDYYVALLLDPLIQRQNLKTSLFQTTPPYLSSSPPDNDLFRDSSTEIPNRMQEDPSSLLPPAQTMNELPLLTPPSSSSNTQHHPQSISDSNKRYPDLPISTTEIALHEFQSNVINTLEPVHRTPMQLLFDEALDAFLQRNYLKARQILKQLVVQSPDSPYSQFALGLSLLYGGEYEESLQAFRQSYQTAKQQNTPIFALWQVPIHEKDFQYQYKKLSRYLEQNPKDQNASSLLFLLTQVGYPSLVE